MQKNIFLGIIVLLLLSVVVVGGQYFDIGNSEASAVKAACTYSTQANGGYEENATQNSSVKVPFSNDNLSQVSTDRKEADSRITGKESMSRAIENVRKGSCCSASKPGNNSI